MTSSVSFADTDTKTAEKTFVQKSLDSKVFTYLNTLNPFSDESIEEEIEAQTPAPTPNLYQLLNAEFAYENGDVEQALRIYKTQAFTQGATTVFERALTLSLEHEDATESLSFAHRWHIQNPEHMPAWFYVAHLALKAHDYEIAGETLERILDYDPQADLTEILKGIYPEDEQEQRMLLLVLQELNIERNAYLSVLEAGLLLRFDDSRIALSHINRAIQIQPNNTAYLLLKADVLQQLQRHDELLFFLENSRKRLPEEKSLYLYQIRYLLNSGLYEDTPFDYDSLFNDNVDDTIDTTITINLQRPSDLLKVKKAWKLLLITHEKFPLDPDITLLAGLVSLDLEEYQTGDRLLTSLLDRPAFIEQVQLYLDISADRQKDNSSLETIE